MKIDIDKPLQLVIEENTAAGNQSPHKVEYVTHTPDGIIVKHKLGGARVQVSMYGWQGEPLAGTPSWHIENVPPEPVVQYCIAFLYNYKGSVCCGMVINRAALDSFFVNNPGKLLTYKEVSFDYINPDKNF